MDWLAGELFHHLLVWREKISASASNEEGIFD
jgi:hypothetical protein